jgi:hypothetical protein
MERLRKTKKIIRQEASWIYKLMTHKYKSKPRRYTYLFG